MASGANTAVIATHQMIDVTSQDRAQKAINREFDELWRSRSDLSGGAVYFFSPNATLYGSVGRTISRLDANGSSLTVGAGVSLGFQHRISGR